MIFVETKRRRKSGWGATEQMMALAAVWTGLYGESCGPG